MLSSAGVGHLVCRRSGEGVSRDDLEALKWIRKAAAQNPADAQFFLGVAYERGDAGVPRDYVEAVKWYRQAAEQGSTKAPLYLAIRYESGEGAPRDYEEAYMWFSLAAAHGEQEAANKLDLIESRLTPEQRAEAQKKPREWKPQMPNWGSLTVSLDIGFGERRPEHRQTAPASANAGRENDTFRLPAPTGRRRPCRGASASGY
jgi:Sel1 repeat